MIHTLLIALQVGVFGTTAFPVAAPSLTKQWSPASIERCDGCETLDPTIRTAATLSPLTRLLVVNTAVNRHLTYTGEAVDRWAPVAETLQTKRGDCEDYAMVKMALLIAAGTPMEAMTFVVVKDTKRNAHHAVLIVKVEGQDWVLDVWSNAVVEAERFPHYEPMMSLTGGKAFVHSKRVAP